jgi:hypothetical protein
VAAHPHAFPLRGGDLVANALAGDLSLELREGQQHIEGQAAHAGRGVECLRHRHERNPMRIEELNKLGKVSQRAGEAIDFVDDDDIDLARTNVGQKLLQAGTLHRPAREATIIIRARHKLPALMRL